MKPEYYQISWKELFDCFDGSSFLRYLTSVYGLPVLLAALVFPLVFLLKKNSKMAVLTAAFIQGISFILSWMPEVYGGSASGYDQMQIDLYVIRMLWVLLLVGGAYWTMYCTQRYRIGERIVVALIVLAWWGRASLH